MDVGLSSTTTFVQLPLRTELKRALERMGFHTPSPIQLKALPIALFGSDVIGQAKSGTGKTAVFGVTAIDHVLHRLQQQQKAQQGAQASASDPFALILAPTREIAMQIDSVLRQLATDAPAVRIVPLIGGLPISQDKRRLRDGCHIVVGTPGRVRWLIEDGVLRPKMIRLLVFDEVDKLLSGEFLDDIHSIVALLPDRRQTLAFSATFTPEQFVLVVGLMRDPQVVRVRGPTDVTVELVASDEKTLAEWVERERTNEPELWLRHVRQYYRVVDPKGGSPNDVLHLKPKLVTLAALLSEIAFNQCIVFCNDKFRAEALAAALESQGWPAAAITGAQTQVTRNDVMGQFRGLALRVLVSTDLTARGIDVEKVNFVVNLDLPRDPATYLHRVGRTGRFGGKHGLAVTLLTESEVDGIRLLSRVFKMSVDVLPKPVPRDVRSYVGGSTMPSRREGEEDVGEEEEAEEEVHHHHPHEHSEDDQFGDDEDDGETDEDEQQDACDEGQHVRLADHVQHETEYLTQCSMDQAHGPQTVASIDHSQLPVRSPVSSFEWEERCYTTWLQTTKWLH